MCVYAIVMCSDNCDEPLSPFTLQLVQLRPVKMIVKKGAHYEEENVQVVVCIM